MKLNRGENRIKVSRSGCYGACRFRQVCQINENTRVNGNIKNSALWLKNTHNFSDEQWRDIFNKLANNISLEDELGEYFIPMKIYE
jgi:hypothetical protein